MAESLSGQSKEVSFMDLQICACVLGSRRESADTTGARKLLLQYF